MAGGGGAWKVAYADFVTAMMAFFLVMWITAQNKKVTEAVSHYFNAPYESTVKDPPNFISRESQGLMPSLTGEQTPFYSKGNYDSPSVVQMEMLRQLNERLLKALQTSPDSPDGNSVKLELTGSGLNVTVFDRTNKRIFKPNSSNFTDYGRWVFSTLAWEVARYKYFAIDLEGHTELKDDFPSADYDKWLLSTDRAHAARRLFTEHGVSKELFNKISGYGDSKPMPDTNPDEQINSRVSVLLVVNSKPSIQASAK